MQSLYRTEPELVDGAIVPVCRCRECNARAERIPPPGREPEGVEHAENCWLRGVPPRHKCN